MFRFLSAAAIALALVGGSLAAVAPATASEVVGVHIGPIGLGFKVGNGHYYDRDQRRQEYSYPSDWRTYHHAQSWYRNHPHWNDQNDHDWYRN